MKWNNENYNNMRAHSKVMFIPDAITYKNKMVIWLIEFIFILHYAAALTLTFPVNRTVSLLQ